MQRFLPIASTVFVILLAAASSADPILTPSTDQIATSPTQTVISFEVDTNGTPLSALILSFSSLASGLTMLAVSPTDAEIGSSGPSLSGGDWIGSLGGTFTVDRTGLILVGSLTLEGLVHGTPLLVTGSYTDDFFVTIPITPMNIAFVVPEPDSLVLLGLGLVALASRGRSQAK
jgi:hypothetical protein